MLIAGLIGCGNAKVAQPPATAQQPPEQAHTPPQTHAPKFEITDATLNDDVVAVNGIGATGNTVVVMLINDKGEELAPPQQAEYVGGDSGAFRAQIKVGNTNTGVIMANAGDTQSKQGDVKTVKLSGAGVETRK